MLTALDHGVPWLAARALQSVPILAAMVLLASCLGTSAGGGNGGNGGIGYACTGDIGGGTGDDGGTGGYGGGGGGGGANGADGASGGSYTDSDSVVGSGHQTSRLVALPGVTSVVVGAGFVVHVKVGGPEQATIRMDDNLTERIEATVSGGQLCLGLKPGANVRTATLSAEVTVGHLDRLTASGARQVRLVSPLTGSTLQLVANGASRVTGSVKVDNVEATASGASTLALSGHVSDLHLSAAGSSQLLGRELAVANLDVVLSGASDVTVAVSDTIAVQATGASVLHYRGVPQITRQHTSGASSIVQDPP